MKNPLSAFQDRYLRAESLAASIERFLLSEIKYVKQLSGIAAVVLQKGISGGSEKAARRKVLRLIRKAEWSQRHLRREVDSLLKVFPEMDGMLQLSGSRALEGGLAAKFSKKVSVYHHALLRPISRKDGILSDAVRAASWEKIEPAAQQALTEGGIPLLAAIKELRTFLQDNKRRMEIEMVRQNSIELDLTEAATMFRGILAEPIFIIDADFAVKIEQERLNRRKTLYELNLSQGVIHIPDKVYREMTHRPKFAMKGLVAKNFVNYLLGTGKAEKVTVEPSVKEKEHMLQLWGQTAKGGRLAYSEDNRERFARSGDMEILVHASRNARRRPVIILSNDDDIIGVARYIPGAIAVYSYDRGTLVPRH